MFQSEKQEILQVKQKTYIFKSPCCMRSEIRKASLTVKFLRTMRWSMLSSTFKKYSNKTKQCSINYLIIITASFFKTTLVLVIANLTKPASKRSIWKSSVFPIKVLSNHSVSRSASLLVANGENRQSSFYLYVLKHATILSHGSKGFTGCSDIYTAPTIHVFHVIVLCRKN